MKFKYLHCVQVSVLFNYIINYCIKKLKNQKKQTSYTYAIAFSARLNGLQVDQVDRENDKRTSTYTQLVLSKLVATCNLACM